MAVRRPLAIDEIVYAPAPTGGWNPDANTWELPPNQAPVLDNAIIRPGRIAVRGSLNNWADLSAITTPVAPLNVAGVQPVPGTPKLAVGRKALSATAFVDPWFAPIVRPAAGSALAAPTADLAIAFGATSFTNTATAANLIPGPRGISFEGTRYYIGYGTLTAPVADAGGTFFAQSTNLCTISSAGAVTALTNAPRGFIDIKGYQSRIWGLGGIDDPASGTTFNALALFFTNPIGPGGGNTASFADWKDPVFLTTNKIVMDGDTTDPGVGLATVRNGLLIFRKSSVWLLRGTTTASYTLVPVTRQVGCVDPRSIVETDKGVYFMSTQGLMLTDGTTVQNVSGTVLYTLQNAVTVVLAAIISSFGGYVTATIASAGQLIISMGIASVTSSAPDGHLQPVWSGMYDPNTNAWTRITSSLFLTDGVIVTPGNNYPGQVFTTPDLRVMSIGDKYITQWEAAASSNLVTSLTTPASLPTAAANDATVGGTQAWTNPANIEVADGNYASTVVAAASVIGSLAPGTIANDASNGGTLTWSNIGSNIVASGPVANGVTTEWGVFTNFSFPTIPSNAIILSVFVSIGVRSNSIGNLAVGGVKLVKGGALVGNNHVADQSTNINGGQKQWGRSSGFTTWGVSLTPSDINSSGFGFAFYGTGPGPTGGDTIKLDFNVLDFAVTYMVPTNYLKASSFGFNIPPAAVITGIQAQYLRQVTGRDAFDLEVKLIKAGAIQTTNRGLGALTYTNDPLTGFCCQWSGLPVVNGGTGPSTDTYGGAADLWGGTWTPSDINNSGFGIAISAGIFAAGQADVDSVVITVFYTLASITHQQSFVKVPALYDLDAAGNFQPIPFRWVLQLFPLIGTSSGRRRVVQLKRFFFDYVFQGIGLPSSNGFTVRPIDAAGNLISGSVSVQLPPTNNSMVSSSISGGQPNASTAIERSSTDLLSEASDMAFDVTWTDAQQSTQPSYVAAEIYGAGIQWLPGRDLR